MATTHVCIREHFGEYRVMTLRARTADKNQALERALRKFYCCNTVFVIDLGLTSPGGTRFGQIGHFRPDNTISLREGRVSIDLNTRT